MCPYRVLLLLSMCMYTECSIPPSCDHWFDAGVNESGVYPVKPDDGEPFQVCAANNSIFYYKSKN